MDRTFLSPDGWNFFQGNYTPGILNPDPVLIKMKQMKIDTKAGKRHLIQGEDKN